MTSFTGFGGIPPQDPDEHDILFPGRLMPKKMFIYGFCVEAETSANSPIGYEAKYALGSILDLADTAVLCTSLTIKNAAGLAIRSPLHRYGAFPVNICEPRKTGIGNKFV